MNLSSARAIKAILAKYSIKPNRRLGQNFLVDRHAVTRLAAAGQIQQDDTILEIGPGIGTLTQELALRAKKVIAVEKDQKMVEILKETLADYANVEIVYADALKTNYTRYKILDTGYKVIANLPYYITAPVIRKFLELESSKKPDFKRKKVGLRQMTLIVQKEVAQRICAKPPNMSIMAVSVQVYAIPKIVGYIKKQAFWPQPKVDGAILQIIPHSSSYQLDFPKFFTIVKAGFAHPRKQLLNNFSTGLKLPRPQIEQWLLASDIQPTRRAETLSVQDWINLINNFIVSQAV